MFTHKYKDTFKTMEGAILTLLIYIALTVVAGIYMQNMMRRTEQIINSKTEFSDLSNDQSPFIFESGTSNINQVAQQNSNLLSKFFEEKPSQSVKNFFFAFAMTRNDGSVIDFSEV